MSHRVLWGILLASGLSAAQAQVCEVAGLVGEARNGSQALKVGSPVGVGDQVQTGAKSRLRLRCADGSSIVVAADSQLRIDAFEAADGKRQQARLFLQLGLIGQKVTPGGGWNVRTPSAVTAVRGTEYAVEVGGAGATAVLMQSGSVEVQPVQAQTRSIGAALPMIALAGLMGTDCQVGKGCSNAAPWPAERVKATLDRLSGI